MPDLPSEPDHRPRGLARLAAAIVVAGGVTPVLLYWLLFGRIATVTPQEAKAMLRAPEDAAALVDVRSPQEFAAGHIDGAVNWPLHSVKAAEGADDVPPELRAKRLLLVCDVGMASRLAAWRLTRAGLADALNVRGGIQEWIRSAAEELGPQCLLRGMTGPEILHADPPPGGPFDRWRTAEGVGEFPFHRSPPHEQALAVLAFFVIKPVYTLLSLAVAVVLWPRREPDLVALRWAMIWFFLGENACALNYLGFGETSYVLEYLHSYGMLLCFAFTAYAVVEAIDGRMLLLSAPRKRCAALALCAACAKTANVPCGLRRTFMLLLPVLIVLAMMLPASDWHDASYNTMIFGRPYNYAHLRVYQQLENWYCAAAAGIMFGASLAALCAGGARGLAAAKVFFAAGVGPLGFGALRAFLGGAYDRNRVWYLFWEETTELLFIAAVAAVLWVFRRGLFPEEADEPSPS